MVYEPIMERFKFSVALPNYNDGHFLRECLNSLLCQDYENYEVWVYDNQSTDNSVYIIKEYIEKDNRFHLIEAPKHYPHGSHGINEVIKNYATGELATWINADDQFHSNYFSTLAPYFENPDVGFVRIALRAYMAETPQEKTIMPPSTWKRPLEILNCNQVFPMSPFRREVFLNVDGIDEEERFWDWDFWIKVFLAGYQYESCSTPLVTRKIHGNWTPTSFRLAVQSIKYKYADISDKYKKEE